MFWGDYPALQQLGTDRREQCDDKGARPEHETGIDRAIAIECLQHLRDQIGRPEQTDAKHEEQCDGDSEIAAFQKAEIDDGVFGVKLPGDGSYPSENRHNNHGRDEAIVEPVVNLPTIERNVTSS